MWFWPFSNMFGQKTVDNNAMFPAWAKWAIVLGGLAAVVIFTKKIADKYV